MTPKYGIINKVLLLASFAVMVVHSAAKWHSAVLTSIDNSKNKTGTDKITATLTKQKSYNYVISMRPAAVDVYVW